MSKQANRKTLNRSVKEKITKRDGFLCKACLCAPVMEIHHKKALVNGGTDDLDNLVGLCHTCHLYVPDEAEFDKYCENWGNLGPYFTAFIVYGLRKLCEEFNLNLDMDIYKKGDEYAANLRKELQKRSLEMYYDARENDFIFKGWEN